MTRNVTSEGRDAGLAAGEPLRLGLLFKAYRTLGRHSILLVLGCLLIFAAVYADMAIIREIKRLVDRPDLARASLWTLLGPLVGWCLVNRICGGLQWLVTQYATNSAIERLRKQLFAKLTALSKAFYDDHQAGWLVARNTGDMQMLWRFLTFAINMTVLFLTSTLFSLGEVFRIDPILLLPAAAAFPLFLALSYWFKRHMATTSRANREENSRLIANLSETIRGIRVIQAFRREPYNQTRFDEQNEHCRELEIRAAQLSGIFMPSLDLMGVVNLLLVVGLGSWLVSQNHITPDGTPLTTGDFVAYILYMNVVLFPLRIMVEIYSMALTASVAAERVFEILEMEPSVPDLPAARPAPILTGAVTLTGVSFRYTPDTPWVLRHFDLAVEAGTTLAIVGETGAGKTTLAALMARFYDPQEGTVSWDGQDVRTFTQESLHRQMGIVLQQSYLFTGTVLENLTFGRPGATREEVRALAEGLGTHAALDALPRGYDTTIREGGESLSLGQRQLIGITRAMVADPRVLILDEPTSSLDSYTERTIQKALEAMTHDRTVVVIAHRLSTVRRADRILVLQDGGIREDGTHETLVAARGAYADLVQRSALFVDRDGCTES